MGGGGTVVLRALPFRRSGLSGVGLSAQRVLVAAGRLSSLPPPHDCPACHGHPTWTWLAGGADGRCAAGHALAAGIGGVRQGGRVRGG
jgi:hypothetical protein